MSEKVNDFLNENKVLTESIKRLQSGLKELKTCLKRFQADATLSKENYKKKQLENKYLLTKLEDTKELIKSSDYTDELERKITTLNIQNKQISDKCTHLTTGL